MANENWLNRSFGGGPHGLGKGSELNQKKFMASIPKRRKLCRKGGRYPMPR